MKAQRTKAASKDKGQIMPAAPEKNLPAKFPFDLIVKDFPGIFCLIDRDGGLLRWNEGLEKLLGLSSGEVPLIPIADLFAESHRETSRRSIDDLIANGETAFEAELVSADGESKIFAFTGKKVSIEDDGYFLLNGVDISSQKVAERKLRDAGEGYAALIEESSEGIWRLGLIEPIPVSLNVEEQIELIFENGYIAECNDVKAQQYGFLKAREVIGKSISEFLVRSDEVNSAYFRKFITSGYRLIEEETHGKDKDGDRCYFLGSLIGNIEDGNLVRAWGTQREITDTKELRQMVLEPDEQLRRSQKVEAIGRLAGGVAHDFNNFLAVIMLHVDMLSLQLPAGSPLRFRIDEIKSVTNNAAGMVRQLLAFGRKQTMSPQPLVLNNVAHEFMNILRPLIGEDIEVEMELDGKLGVCFVDPDQVTQVLMNLAVNARDAMPKGGTLKITTSNVSINSLNSRLKSQPTGDYIQLSVSDNGSGMDSKTRKRIFEPFFTTKGNKGTGLGLATVYGIVKQSNGFIWVDSERKVGTTFEVQFPRIDQPAKTLLNEEAAPGLKTGTETILLVEDEDSLRRAALEALTVLGYEVFDSGDGERAIELAKVLKKPIHLLLTDVVMPKMNGRDLAKKIKKLHPETAVLFMSGYNDDIISNHGILEENVQFLSKPFSPLTLADKVRSVLEKSKDGLLRKPGV